jgi:phosphoribosylanthranilate isomerase
MVTESSPLVKICGLTRNVDARFADEAGADYLGLIMTEGFGRSVTKDVAAAVVKGVLALKVAVTVNESVKKNADLADAIGASIIQLHGNESVAVARSLKNAGDWSIWKAVRAKTTEDVQRVVEDFGELVDGILVEGYRDGAVGGSGLTLELDPDALSVAKRSTLSVVLAGGLTPTSVAGAVARYSPDVVDVSSGVEVKRNVKDPRKVEAFIQKVRKASLSREDPLQD